MVWERLELRDFTFVFILDLTSGGRVEGEKRRAKRAVLV